MYIQMVWRHYRESCMDSSSHCQLKALCVYQSPWRLERVFYTLKITSHVYCTCMLWAWQVQHSVMFLPWAITHMMLDDSQVRVVWSSRISFRLEWNAQASCRVLAMWYLCVPIIWASSVQFQMSFNSSWCALVRNENTTELIFETSNWKLDFVGHFGPKYQFWDDTLCNKAHQQLFTDTWITDNRFVFLS